MIFARAAGGAACSFVARPDVLCVQELVPEHGAEDFGGTAYPNRRLFWVRLLEQIPPMTLPSSLDRFGGGGFASAFLLDWVLANQHLRAIAASSPHVYANDVPPSDHWPIHAVYEVTSRD